MDAKERWLIEQTRSTLESGSFSEHDVLGLLILLRRHAPACSAVREFGDFVAHREKDRGILHTYLCRIQTALNGTAAPHDQPLTLPIFTSSDIHASLNELLTSLGISPIDAELGNRLAVCIISLLQSVKVDTQLNTPALGFVSRCLHLRLLLWGLVRCLPATSLDSQC